jgi:PhnB protein
MRMPGPDGIIAHAELEIGDSVVMLADPSPQAIEQPPKQVGATSVGIFTYVEDVDTVFKTAIDARATTNAGPENMFWGDRFGTLTDPYGHLWHLATHVEDVPPEEMEERSKEFMAAMATRWAVLGRAARPEPWRRKFSRGFGSSFAAPHPRLESACSTAGAA